MASQASDQTADADRISFVVERVARDDHGHVLVSGRWFGVRGRRFVRPTLTLTMRADGGEQRSLADLEHKPWAAEDGQPWLASFPLDVELKDAAQLELSVAPDIAVELPQGRGTARQGRVVRTATDARAPRIRGDRIPARPSRADQAFELERLRSRLAIADRATAHEHARREESEQALEDERSEARRLRSELGRLRSELDIANATGTELAAASAELDAVRLKARESDRQLQATVRGLDQQRAESERLRMRLTAAEATVERLTRAHQAAERAAAERATEVDPGRSAPAPEVRETRGSSAAPARAPSSYPPSNDQPQARAEPGAQRGSPWTDSHYVRPRPLNPALRRPNWALRLLTLIMILGVIAAIVLVIHSTVAHP